MADGGTARRRRCESCGKRWWAVQPPEQEVEGWRLVWKWHSGKRTGTIVALLPPAELPENSKV